MQTKSSPKSTGTQRNRGNNKPGRNIKTPVPSSSIPGRSGRAGAKGGAARTIIPPLLNPGFGPVQVFYIDDDSIFDNCRHDPATVPTALVSLYKCLKQHPDFKDDKEWKEYPSIPQLADYLLKKAAGLTSKGAVWSFRHDEHDRLSLKYVEEIGSLARTFCLPTEWIPLIKDSNPALYDLIVCVLGKVAVLWDLDIILNGHNEIIRDEADGYKTGEAEEDAKLLRHLKLYEKGGEAYKFMQSLQKSGRRCSKPSLKARIRKMKYTTPLEKEIGLWLNLAMPAMDNNTSIHNYYINDPETFNDGDPVNANDMFKINWSFHDKVASFEDDFLNDIAGMAGVIGPMKCSEFLADRKPFINDITKIQYLADFLERGREIYFDHYDGHFDALHEDENYKSRLVNILV